MVRHPYTGKLSAIISTREVTSAVNSTATNNLLNREFSIFYDRQMEAIKSKCPKTVQICLRYF